MIQAYCGEGKGKSTAGIGLLVRAVGKGLRGHLIMFDKGSETYRHHEIEPLRRLGVKVDVTGQERMLPTGGFRFSVTEEDRLEARRGLDLAEQAVVFGTCDVLVLDEVLSVIGTGLLPRDPVLHLLERVPCAMELVLTGRCEDAPLLEKADLVTNMTKMKHYFDQGIRARPGIEY